MMIKTMAQDQRRRLVATIMNALEREGDVSPEVRQRVLGAVGQYHDFVLDLIKASAEETTGINTEALDMLTQIRLSQTRLVEAFEKSVD